MIKSKLISWLAVFLWMGAIFLFSNQPATDSSELSSGVTEIVLKAAEKIIPEIGEHWDSLHHIVRKNAHFTIYLILGALTINALAKSGVLTYRSIVSALAICVLYAVSDELHQLLIPGRSGEVKDVFIDSSGAFVGIALYLLVNWLQTRKKHNKSWKEITRQT
ncbi:VanZ family protein [Planomicrobium sp. CPCC 101079]|uniref:VanZ family protein n=1 Tax=Planomicrobium sp. CPCC 101079 TaxID=2599618 RepID=UPI0011B7415D|nr:VanZ family protein [Planomicrobium sp. CPCC 101079]TWT03712.1 VanZ family protein [Planomicrobium sp. CPCC 101079]